MFKWRMKRFFRFFVHSQISLSQDEKSEEIPESEEAQQMRRQLRKLPISSNPFLRLRHHLDVFSEWEASTGSEQLLDYDRRRARRVHRLNRQINRAILFQRQPTDRSKRTTEKIVLEAVTYNPRKRRAQAQPSKGKKAVEDVRSYSSRFFISTEKEIYAFFSIDDLSISDNPLFVATLKTLVIEMIRMPPAPAIQGSYRRKIDIRGRVARKMSLTGCKYDPAIFERVLKWAFSKGVMIKSGHRNDFLFSLNLKAPQAKVEVGLLIKRVAKFGWEYSQIFGARK